MLPQRNTLLLASQIVVMLSMLAGCAMSGGEHSSPLPAATASSEPELADQLVPVVRYGRYTLVELRPEFAQNDLSRQIVDVTMPAQPSATVGDGMQHLLQRTGYSLCRTEAVTALYALPLPAAHLHLGPQELRDALQTLAGPAWSLVLDQVTRKVCFARLGEAPEITPMGVAP
ncbi:PFGI-1 class ICE element type IV pilus protein PilL2 [Pseudomonas aeruginosa]